MKTFKKILIANRGEIAVRIIRTCRDMGIQTAAVYSQADADALHVKLADEAHDIGPAEALQSYLNIEKVLDTAERCGADAIHPGYGFLSENPEFAEMAESRGITFIGPSSSCIYKAKPKNRARQMMKMLNIPVTPGSDEEITDTGSQGLKKAREIAAEIGYPVVVKPSGAGGGIGITRAINQDELDKAVELASTRGRKAFGLSGFYIEKWLTGVKHVEFQVLADKFGHVVHLGDRDCSVQRRFQKLIEVAPCSLLPSFLRMKMGAAAIDVAMTLDYVGALTVEFFYIPGNGLKFYFNEINSRLQVEHGITELVTDFDLVKEQIKIAAGNPLGIKQDDIRMQRYAIECRINAEDPVRFIPSPGTIKKLYLPLGPGIRIDEGIYEGYSVPYQYDSLLMKLMSWGKTRDDAIARMKRALGEMRIEGVKTTVPLHRVVLEDEDFVSGKYTTELLCKKDILEKVMGRK
ncbi:MAG: ATP-grasp domain-containing protein [Thermodesulfobacteriota bacterium]|nr:MAG: ATP-grasp domain-containing protein [Thermodesulfobacteriota bacterium]